jgi:hypothetical protein
LSVPRIAGSLFFKLGFDRFSEWFYVVRQLIFTIFAECSRFWAVAHKSIIVPVNQRAIVEDSGIDIDHFDAWTPLENFVW